MEYIATYFPAFEKNAAAEIISADSGCVFKPIAASLGFVSNAGQNFLSGLKKSPPIFLRHIMPVHAEGFLNGDADADKEELLIAAKKTARLKTGDKFSVQCRVIGTQSFNAKDVEVKLGSYFENEGGLPVFCDDRLQSEETYAISVLIIKKKYFVGFSPTEENLNNHPDEYRVLSRGGGKIISRAEYKLIEALYKFNVAIKSGGTALDLGAAPGGWTRVLLEHGLTVHAVDPGELHESLAFDGRVHHHKYRIENLQPDDKFDMIVNDMNIDPQTTAKIMVSLAGSLACGGVCVVTLKLPFSDADRSLSETKKILEEKYELIAIKNLTHNRREVTALLSPLRL